LTVTSDDLYCCLRNGIADGIIVSDAQGVVTQCNAAFCKLIGAAEESIIGRRLESVIQFDSESLRTTFNTTDGSEGIPAMLDGFSSAKIITGNGPEFIMPATRLSLKDAAGHKQGEAVVVYIVQSNTVQQAQTEFVSTVSHELRTPLTSIKGFADTILRAGGKLDQANQRRYVGIIKDQADRLTRLVEDLLAVSRLEARKLQLTIRAIDIKEAIQRVIRNLFEKSHAHTIVDNSPAGLPAVWADADRLEQILTNLIDNAIKYSPTGTTITIGARESTANPKMIEFSVSDQGVGIAPEHLPRIFSKFSRADNPLTRQTEGTGLGLYITRSLVLALGGQISADSSSTGTTFTVSLPTATLEDQAARGRGS
jgi:two-component system, OmpR family, phosphate regulon sensor histidine kinase PhoR